MAKDRAKGSVQTLDGVTIEQWREGAPSGGEADKIDVTTHDTPGNSREFLTGFDAENDYSYEVLWDPTLPGHQKLEELKTSGEEVPGTMSYPNGWSHTYDAVVTQYGLPTTAIDGALVRPVTLSISNIALVPTVSL